MIESFYGLSGSAFKLSLDPRFFFGSSGHKKAMAFLTYGLRQGEGFIVITGEVGAGKSTLMTHLLDGLDRQRCVAGYLVTSNLQSDDALKLILHAFEITSQGDGKAALLEAFEAFLRTQYADRRRVLLIVDEAQNLPKTTIEELRMLTNFQFEGWSPFQVFLVGQPQFRVVLADPDLEQLRQRVIASYHLGPLSLEETGAYIEHRLKTVGWRGRPHFSPEAISRIHDYSGGMPRLINILCGRLMLFGALEEIDEFDNAVVETVVSDLSEEVAGGADLKPGMRALPVDPSREATRAERVHPAEARTEGRVEQQRISALERRLAALTERHAWLANGKLEQIERRIDALESASGQHQRAIGEMLESLSGYFAAVGGAPAREKEKEERNGSFPS